MKWNRLLVSLGVLVLLFIGTTLSLSKWQDRRDHAAIRAFCHDVVEGFGAKLHLVTDAKQCQIKWWDASFAAAEYLVRLDSRHTLWIVRTKPLNPFGDGVVRTAEVNQNGRQLLKLELDQSTGSLKFGRGD